MLNDHKQVLLSERMLLKMLTNVTRASAVFNSLHNFTLANLLETDETDGLALICIRASR